MPSAYGHYRFSYKDFLIPTLLSLIVAVISSHNFLLFHTLAEIFAIAVAILMALVAWNMYPFTRNAFLLYLGIGYFWIGTLDLMHTLTYKDLNIFAVTGTGVATQFWISTRYMEALVLLTAPWFILHTINRRSIFVAIGILSFLLELLILQGMFPTTYIDGVGLTDFKVYSEYVIIAILIFASIHLFQYRHRIDSRVYHLMLVSIVLTMLAELTFTFYVSIYDISNMLGHIFKIFSYWAIFLAVIKLNLQEPFAALSRVVNTYDAMPDAVLLIDEAGAIRQANRQAALMAKMSVAELIGCNSFDVFHLCGSNKNECPAFCQQIGDDAACEREVVVGGEKRWLSYSYTSYGDEFRANGRLEVIRDVSQRKRAELQYEQMNTIKNSIIENLPMTLFVKDAKELKYIEWNKKAEELTGLSRQDVYGKDDYAFWPQEQAESFVEKDMEVLRERKLLDIPREMVTSKHGTRTVHTKKIPIYDEEGEPQYLLGIAEDITDKLSTEHALRHSQKMDALGKLTGGVAHDFNNMLSVVSGFSELLMLQAEGNPRMQGYINEIMKASSRGSMLTSKLLSFTRNKTVSAAQININEILLDEQHMLEKTLTVRIALELELTTNPWPIYVDSNDLVDAIVNMAINAMHAMSGNGTFRIATENTIVGQQLAREIDVVPGEYLHLILTDTGTGMDANTRTHIFDPFFSTKGEFGTGLGLSQVYGFIRRSQGGIKVDSTPGKGSSFHLYFPHYDNQPAPSPEASDELETLHHANGSILVVDDEDALRQLMYDLLSGVGYEVVLAENGKQALALLQEQSFDLMISDVVMPGMDGYELAVLVQQQYPHMPIQITSGYSESIDNSALSESLRTQTLQKPFTRSQLIKRVHELLG